MNTIIDQNSESVRSILEEMERNGEKSGHLSFPLTDQVYGDVHFEIKEWKDDS